MIQSIFIPNGVLAIFSVHRVKRGIFKSLKIKSLVILILFGLIPLICFSIFYIDLNRSKSVSQRTSEVLVRGNIISNLIVNSGYFSTENIHDVDAEISQVSDMYDGRILIVDQNYTVVKDTYRLEEGSTAIMPEVLECFEGNTNQIVNQSSEGVKILLPVRSVEDSKVKGVVIMNFSFQSINTHYDSIASITISVIVVIALVVILLAWLNSQKLIEPMKHLNQEINAITESNFGIKMDVKDYTEMEVLSDSINSMLDNVQRLEESREEFVSNVSHELKTPITSMKVLADSLTTAEDMPVELYKEFMVDINDELDRMNKIVNDLLSLVKMDKNASQLAIEEVNINEFIENIMKSIKPIAEERNIEIVFESTRPVNAQIDPVKLGMAISNLIENAVKYNYDNGWVNVALNADHKFMYIKISDSGVGIPDDEKEHIFDRFYRVDKARSRETGGNGLGLSITRNAILLHKGSIKVHSLENHGTVFAVRIPLIYTE